MTEQNPAEDPIAYSSQKVVSYVSVAAVAAEAIAQVAAHRAAERAAADERAAAAARAQREAAYARDRLGWSPVLDPRRRDRLNLVETGAAWAHTQPWRGDPEADLACAAAEDRLRVLRPDVMDRYDRLRQDGADPVTAMTRVAPYFDQPPPRTGQPGPDRAALLEHDVARRAGDAELAVHRQRASVGDDPRTRHVDERHAAAAQAAPHLRRGVDEHARADAAAAASHPLKPRQAGAGAVAAEDYPKPVHAATVGAARAAAAGRPGGVTTVQHRAPAQVAPARRAR